MKYTCNACNYTTERKYNYDTHIKSKQHINNSEGVIIKKEKPINRIIYNCDICTIFSTKHRSSYYRHRETCVTKNKKSDKDVDDDTKINNENELVKKIELLSEKLKNTEEKLKNTDEKLKNTEVERITYKVKYDMCNETIEYHKKLLERSGTIINNTLDVASKTANIALSSINYLMATCGDAKKLKKIKDYGRTCDDEIPIEDTLIYKYENGQLHKFFGDILIKEYKKEDFKTQSVWNTDTARQNYAIVGVVNDKNKWIVDKKGLLTVDAIVKPLVEYYSNMIDHKNQVIGQNLNHKMSLTELENAVQKQGKLSNIGCELKKPNIEDDIIKYISPYFYLDIPKIA